GSLLVASHDRAFLDGTVTRIWELRDRRLTAFRGDYSAYHRQREERDTFAAKTAESTAGAIERERELVQTYRSHRKFAKMHEHEARLGRLETERHEAPRSSRKLRLPGQGLVGAGPVRSGEIVIRAATVLDALLESVPVTPGEARAYLARFLFRGDDVFREVRLLSGGERSRLELALLGVMPSNVYLLDEPTNHLDVVAREAIENFLVETPATMLVVSHDRRFLDTVCDRLWVVDDGIVAPFDGGYKAWRHAVSDGWTVASALEQEAKRLRPGGRAAPVSPGRLESPARAAGSSRATRARASSRSSSGTATATSVASNGRDGLDEPDGLDRPDGLDGRDR